MPFKLKKLYSDKKQRAFKFLINELGYTQRESQRLIANGRLFINGVAMTVPTAEVEGEFEFVMYEPSTRNLIPHAVYEKFVLFDKPSGVLIHPQNRDTQYSLVDELKYQFGLDANIAHRIDQETSGLVLCARDKQSEKDIKAMFEFRSIQKKYLALVHGEFKNKLIIEEPLLRKEDESAVVRMIVKVHQDGKLSKTTVTPIKYFSQANMTLVECKPFTGRQHQIRVHLFHVKHPIVGDPIYGQDDVNVIKFLDKKISKSQRIQNSGASRLLLHASELEFELYNKNYIFQSKDDFLKIIEQIVSHETLGCE